MPNTILSSCRENVIHLFKSIRLEEDKVRTTDITLSGPQTLLFKVFP